MIEDIFLTYANNSLKEDPTHLYKIFKIIEQNININLEGVEEAINLICELLKNNDFETILSLILEMIIEHGYISHADERTAYLAFTGPRHHYYLDRERYKDDPEFWESEKHRRNDFKCEYREINEKVLGEDLCEEYFDLKCYECHQLKFIDFLNEIVGGKEYSEIKDIEDILYDSSILSSQVKHRTIQKLDQRAPSRETLQADDFFIYGYYDYIRGDYGNSYHAFNEYLINIAYFSATDFLLNNDRRKLKECPYCNKFYIAKNINRKTRCYRRDCEKAYQRDKKRKQRTNEPDIYY